MEGLSRLRPKEPVSKMLVPVVFQAVPLLLCDRILLSLLAGWGPSIEPLGGTAAWLEAALRLLVLWGIRGLLSLGGTSPMSSSTVAAVSIGAPLYLLVGHWLGDPPLLVSSAPWSWWLAIYGAVGFSQLLWGILAEGRSTGESRKEDKATFWKMLRLLAPDKLYLTGASFFLILAVIGETFLSYYTGRLIDILSTKYDAEAFSTAIFLLCLVSFGSSACASFRGGLFIFTISRLVIRTRNLLFSSLLRQDLAFFQEVKTGTLTSRLSKDTTMMSRSVPLNTNVFLRTLIKAVGLYVFMIGLSWRLTLLMLIETPLLMAVQKVYTVRHQALLKEIQDSVACSEEVVREVISSVESVRSFATEEEESRRYEASLEKACRLKNQRKLERIVYLFVVRVRPEAAEFQVVQGPKFAPGGPRDSIVSRGVEDSSREIPLDPFNCIDVRYTVWIPDKRSCVREMVWQRFCMPYLAAQRYSIWKGKGFCIEARSPLSPPRRRARGLGEKQGPQPQPSVSLPLQVLRLSMKLLLLFCGYQQIHTGLMTEGNLVSFILYQTNVGRCVQALIYTYGDALSNVGAAEKVFEYIDREPSVRTEGTLSPETFEGRVSSRNVFFCYPSRPEIQVLKNVSFELRPGEVMALVGLNGSGKSSCVALLEHFYEPQSGEVLLDGVPVGKYEHKYLHRQVALVGQEPILFSGSIRENITYGLQGCSQEDVIRAAKEADALGFIRELEGGFDADPAVCEEWRPGGAGDCSPDADGGERRQDRGAGKRGGCGEGDSHGADGPERPLLQTGGEEPGGVTSGVALILVSGGS